MGARRLAIIVATILSCAGPARAFERKYSDIKASIAGGVKQDAIDLAMIG